MNRTAPETEKAIFAKDLLDFFVELRKKHHHIFAILSHVPLTAFRILAADGTQTDRISINEFLKKSPGYHPRRTLFTVRYRTYRFKEERTRKLVNLEYGDIPFNGIEQVTCDTPESLDGIIGKFESILAYLMREALLEGRPFRFDGYTCRELKLTTDDVEAFRHTASRCHARIIKEFADDYLRLGKILKAPEV